MSEAQPPRRLYGEQEIGRILKRATELQHREPSAPSAAGMTLAELEDVAAEAGIDPRYLRQAALEVETGAHDGSFWAKVVGEDLMLIREVTLPGEVADDGFERIVSAIQTHSREHGQPSLLGRTLTWRAETANKTRTVQIVVTSRDGQTQVRLEENLSQTAVGLFAGMTAGWGLGAGIGFGLPIGLEVLGSLAFTIAAPIGAIALSYIASRAIYRGMVKRRRSALGALFDRTVAEAQASIAEAALEEGEPPAALPSGG